MLKIVRPPSDGRLHNPWNYGPMRLYSGQTYKDSYLRPLYVMSNSPTTLSYNVKGQLVDGEFLSSWGDRWCTHSYYEGLIVACNEIALSSSTSGAIFKVGDKEYTTLVFPGMPVLDVFDTNNKGDLYPRTRIYYHHFNIGTHIGYKMITKNLSTGKLSSGDLWYVCVNFTRKAASQMLYESGPASMDWLYTIPKTLPVVSGYIAYNPGTRLTSSKTPEEVLAYSKILRRPKLNTFYDGVVNDSDIFGSLAQDAVDRTSYFSSNGYEMISEADTLFSQFTSWFPKGMSMGNLAKSFLGYTYGPATTLRELTSLANGIKRSMKTKAGETRASRSTSTFYPNPMLDYKLEYHYKVVYRNWDQGVLSIYNKLETWGLAPKVESAWDLVPLSFVFDWFFDLGSLLGKLDTQATFKKFDVVGVTRSKKSTQVLPIDVGLPGFGGSIVQVLYTRELKTQLDKPPLFDVRKDFRNTVEATALIISAVAKK